MSWLPALTLLAAANAILLIAIAVAPMLRRAGLRAWKTRQASVRLAAVNGIAGAITRPAQAVSVAESLPALVARLSDPVLEVRLAAARVIGRRGPGDDLALCRMLSGIDQQTSRALLASLSRRDQPLRSEVVAIAADSQAEHRTSAIRMLGTTSDPRARRALALLVDDRDSSVRHEAATAAAASARIGYPRPLDPVLVDRLLQRLAEETVHSIVAEMVDALAYSLDPRVPAAFLRRIPASGGSLRERLVESGALFAHLVQSAERRRQEVEV